MGIEFPTVARKIVEVRTRSVVFNLASKPVLSKDSECFSLCLEVERNPTYLLSHLRQPPEEDYSMTSKTLFLLLELKLDVIG